MNPPISIPSFHASMLQAWSAFSDEFIAVWNEGCSSIEFCNEAYTQFFGYGTKQDFINQYSFFGCRKHPLGEEIQTLVLDTLKKAGSWTEEVMMVKKNGSSFLCRLDITAFEFEEKLFYLQRIINIDAQRVFSENLFKEVKKFEALFQHATMPIILVNKKGNIILANEQALSLFEYKLHEITRVKVEDLIPMRFREHHVQHRKHYETRPENRPMGRGMKLVALKKDGAEFPVEISLGHYLIDNEPYVIAFIVDITSRLAFENLLRTQKEEVESVNKQIEKLNADLEHKVEVRTQELSEALSKERELSDLKSRFVSMASHEFRTPLSTILSSVSLIGKYVEADEQDKRDKHILRIRSAVNNLTDILNEFLSLGKIEEGKIQVHFSSFNIKEQVQLILSEIRPILKKKQFIKYTHEGFTQVNLDTSLLRNIIINLVSNAIKFSPEEATIWVDSICTDSEIVLTIRDEGLGIPEEDMKHLFERFFRGKNVLNIPGTGLGLHIVSKYVELMGGTIHVGSALEKGTRFTIKFKI
jgi:PAS domain S-box-containing protein